MKKAIALTVGVSLANIFGPVPAFADNPQTVTSERTARNQDCLLYTSDAADE